MIAAETEETLMLTILADSFMIATRSDALEPALAALDAPHRRWIWWRRPKRDQAPGGGGSSGSLPTRT